MENKNNGSNKDLLSQAMSAEENEDYKTAATLYKSIISNDPLHETAYNRLFLVLRKLKDYKQELKWIKAGIKAFTDSATKGKSISKKILELSSKLNKATGLVNKKGEAYYKPGPVEKWEKRMKVVEKRIG